MTAFADREVVFAKADAAVKVEISAQLGGWPDGAHTHTSFSDLDMDDAGINEVADRIAKRMGVRLHMPVACATISDLAWLVMLALEKL
jgi:hypothetical protein